MLKTRHGDILKFIIGKKYTVKWLLDELFSLLYILQQQCAAGLGGNLVIVWHALQNFFPEIKSEPNNTCKNTNNIKKLQSIHILFIFLAYSSSSLLRFHYTSPCFIAVLVQYCSPSLISQEFQVLSYSINSPLSWSSSRSFPVRLPYCNLT